MTREMKKDPTRRGLSAPATAAIRAKTYYHGVSHEVHAREILRTGRLEPGVSATGAVERDNIGRAERQGWTTPVAGRVYVTARPAWAVIYATMHPEFRRRRRGIVATEHGRYGYIFAVDGRHFGDVQPDEDSVGQMLHVRWDADVWRARARVGQRVFDRVPSPLDVPEAPDWLFELAKQNLTQNQWYEVVEYGRVAWQARAGKKLLALMTDAQKLELVELGAHVAHAGALPISAAWRVDKRIRRGDLLRAGNAVLETYGQRADLPAAAALLASEG